MTPRQMKSYRELVARAARELGLSGAEQIEAYRKRVLMDETGKSSSRDVGRTREYEALMLRHAADAGDWRLAETFTVGDAKRMAAMIHDSVRQIGELAGLPDLDRLGYVCGILKQAGLYRGAVCARLGADWWEDYPFASAKMVFCILDTHRRRLVRRLASRTGTRYSASYCYGAVWPAAGNAGEVAE